MTDLIEKDQPGFIIGRQTQDNIRRILHMIDHIQRQGLRAVLVSLDAKKAFDCVNFLVSVSDTEETRIIRTVNTMYSRPLPGSDSEDKN